MNDKFRFIYSIFLMNEAGRRKSEMLGYIHPFEQFKADAFILKFSQVGVKYGSNKDGWQDEQRQA